MSRPRRECLRVADLSEANGPSPIRTRIARPMTLRAFFTAALLSTPVLAGAQTAPPAASHDMVPPPAPADDQYPSLKIVGFGDVNYTQTKRLEGPRGFS